jgi:glyoxylate reductase
MRLKRPFAIVTRKLLGQNKTRMMERFVCRLNLNDKAFDKSAPAAVVNQADVLMPTATDRIDVDRLAVAGRAETAPRRAR